jgi:hypothetical protein
LTTRPLVGEHLSPLSGEPRSKRREPSRKQAGKTRTDPGQGVVGQDKIVQRVQALARRGLSGRRPGRGTAAELRLLGRMADAELAERFGRSERAVCMRRNKLGIPTFNDRRRKA